MSTLSAPRDDITVVIPQYLIDMALKRADKAVADLVAFDEGPALDYPLYVEAEFGPLRFGKFVLMSAALACLLAFTGLQVAQSHAPATVNEVPVASGVQTMSATELVQLIKTENHTVYWLGSKQADSYANTTSANGIDQVFYKTVGTQVSGASQFEVNVGTYRDYPTYEAQPHPLLGANGRTTTLTSGATLTYNSASPNQAVVQFPNKPDVVVLNYPAVQAVPTIINDAENLVPIK